MWASQAAGEEGARYSPQGRRPCDVSWEHLIQILSLVTSDHLGLEELLCCLLLCLLGSGEGDLLLGDLVLRLGESDGDLHITHYNCVSCVS